MTYLDRVLDVEVFERGDVEVRRVEVRLDQPRHDRAAVGVDLLNIARQLRCPDGGARVADPAIVGDNDCITNRLCSRAVDQLTVEDSGGSSCDPHQ